ncbi:glycosyltransferase [Streptomyces spiralis]
MRVLFFANPLPGHLVPLLPLARALRAQGHSIAFSSAPDMLPSLEPEGFTLLPASPTSNDVIAEVARRTGVEILFSSRHELLAEYFAGCRVDLSVNEAVARAREWAPDLVVSEHLDFVGPLVADVLNVPSAVTATGIAPAPEDEDLLAKTVHTRRLDHGVATSSSLPSGRWLLDLCPPSLQRAGRLPLMEHMALRPEPHRGAPGQPRVPRKTGSGRPRVLVSFGSGHGASQGFLALLRSLTVLGVDLVATTAGEPAHEPGPGPGRVELVSDAPLAELLEDVAAVVHDGGPGITFGAAARGLPAVVIPASPEQQRLAERLAAVGAGLVVPTGKRESEVVTAALGELLSDLEFTVAARRIRDEIAAMPSAPEVAEWLAARVAAL